MGFFWHPSLSMFMNYIKKKLYLSYPEAIYQNEMFLREGFFQIKCVWLDDKHGSFLVRT